MISKWTTGCPIVSPLRAGVAGRLMAFSKSNDPDRPVISSLAQHLHYFAAAPGTVGSRPRMSIERQTVTAQAAPPAIGPYSHAVRAGGLLFCSGQIPLDP